MKIICSGFQKTGTKSLAAALRLLGYNVYDFEEQFYYLGKDLNRIFKEGWTNEDIRRIYKDVDAVIDIPSCIFWEDLHKAFPEAKIIHTERSSESEWGNSLMTQIQSMRVEKIARFLMFITPTGRLFSQTLSRTLELQCSSPPIYPWHIGETNKQTAIMRYRQHNSHVRMVAPKNQTLYFHVKEGWEPLCKFLDKPLPNHEFPHENKGATVTGKVVNKSLLFQQIKKEFFIVTGVFSLFMYLLRMLSVKSKLKEIAFKLFQFYFAFMRKLLGIKEKFSI